MNQEISYENLLRIIKLQTEVVQQGNDLANIMTIVTEKTMELTNADGACVELLEQEEFVYSSAAGMAISFLGLRLSTDNSLSGACMSEKQPLISNDIEEDIRVNKVACRKIGLNSMIVVPLMCEEEVVGILKVLSKNINHFNISHIRLLEMISDLIASAMQSAIKNGKNKLLHAATHDSLTGISNRSLFFDRLRRKIVKFKKSNEPLAIILLDMNGLKSINDTFGHRAGDSAIKEVVDRIRPLVPSSYTFSRLGGDEFGIIAPNATSDQIHMLIKKIDKELNKVFCFEANTLTLSISAGASFLFEDGIDMDLLIERADQAMYSNKRIRKMN